MSRWGNAKPRDMETPVSVYNRTLAFEVQHNGLFHTIPHGASMLDPHVAERVVRKRPGDVFYGTSDPTVSEPQEAEEPAAEPTPQDDNETPNVLADPPAAELEEQKETE